MNRHASKTKGNKGQSVSNNPMQSGAGSIFQFVDNRAESVGQMNLQKTVNNGPAMLQLKAFEGILNPENRADMTGTNAVQLYATSRQAGQDGEFIPAYNSAIHCHIGGRMRNPHLKISGDRRSPYNFGNPHDLDRMQAAYNALVAGDNERLAGYADCVEYLEEQGCIAQEDAEATAERSSAPLSAYDDPTTSRASRALIEEGLRTGTYPPRK